MGDELKLYLDVDGVINANYPLWGQSKRGYAYGDGVKYQITWAPPMIVELATLDVELVWATTWRDEARTNIAQLIGWGGHGLVLNPLNGHLRFPSIDWKTDSIYEIHEPEDRFIWIDDEVGPYQRAHFPNALIIAPDSSQGIRREHIQRIRDYING